MSFAHNNNLPKISVITVCFNADKILAQTIESVKKQTYKNIEYIIVDGGSTDGTCSLIQSNCNFITRWISEKDNGIYDAMNKGIKLASGDWVIFMNGGDEFATDEILEKMFSKNSYEDYDILYGNAILVNPINSQITIAKPRPVASLWQGRRTSWIHQSVFAKISLLKEYPFDQSFKIGADFDFYIYHYNHGKKFFYVNIEVSKYLLGGLSDRLDFECNADFLRSITKHKAKEWQKYYYWMLLLFYLTRRTVSRRAIKTNLIYLNPMVKYFIELLFKSN